MEFFMKTNHEPAKPKRKRKNSRTEIIPWHPAFIQALQLELIEYKDILEFCPESQLTSEPLKIDCVVIKKIKDVEIKKNIAVIFKTWNILEYKSPDDYVSIDDYYKVYGYACFYVYSNSIPIDELTVTFVESRYPRELIKHLKKNRGFTVEKNGNGIYNVIGDILPIQIIDSRKLSGEDNLWLKNLSNKLGHTEIDRLLTESAQHGKATQIAAYMYAIVNANSIIMEEIVKVKEKRKTFNQIVEEAGLAAEWEAKGEARGKAEIISLIESGLSLEEIKKKFTQQ
jgi:hypothetical protein